MKHRGEEYNALKSKWEEQLLNVLFQQYPQLKDHIQFKEFGTAITNDFYLGTHQGAAYGLGHTPEQLAQHWLRSKTSIQNLYLSGQDIVSCGVCGAMMGVYLTAGAISTSCLRYSL